VPVLAPGQASQGEPRQQRHAGDVQQTPLPTRRGRNQRLLRRRAGPGLNVIKLLMAVIY
jgi:hypothetical protein